MALPLAVLEFARQIDQAVDVVHRHEGVHVRQHRAHAGGPRLETLVAQQRVEPDELAAGLVQPLHLRAQTLADVAVEALHLDVARLGYAEQRRIGAVFRLLGYEKRVYRDGGRLYKGWERPSADADAAPFDADARPEREPGEDEPAPAEADADASTAPTDPSTAPDGISISIPD